MNIEKKIANPNISYWINASAGTGKTSILVKRVLGLLLNGVAASEIMCLTFTKAAAVEMDQRIKAELAKWTFLPELEILNILNSYDIEVSREKINYVRKIFALSLENEYKINIMTIHSFCQDILQKFSFEIGLPPDFSLLDENEVIEIVDKVKTKIYESFDLTDSDIKTSLQDVMAYASEHVLSSNIWNILRVRKSFRSVLQKNNLSQMKKTVKEFLKIDTDDLSEIFDEFIDNFELNKVCALILEEAVEKKDADFFKSLISWVESDKLEKKLSLNKLENLLLTAKKIPRKKLISVKTSKAYPGIDDYLQGLQEDLVTYIKKNNSIKIYKLTIAIYCIGKLFLDEFDHLKKKANGVDYDDLIEITRDILVDNDLKDWILYKIDSNINHILIDEAQDTSEVQWQIIDSISSDFFSGIGSKDVPRSIFIVGDEKQSIYSFQGADHKYFGKVKEYYQRKTNNNLEEIHLETSFRSSSAILQVIDNIFNQQYMKQNVSVSDRGIIHHCYKLNNYGKIELWPTITTGNENSSLSADLAAQIAEQVSFMINSGQYLNGKKITASSFMILVRKRDDLYFEIIRQLARRKINVSGIDRLDIQENIGIRDLIELAKFSISPYDDLALAIVLKSPIFEISEEDLFEICTQRQSNILQFIESSEKFRHIYCELQNIFHVVLSSPYEFFHYILFKMGCYKNFISRFGVDVEDYVSEFLNLVLEFEKKHPKNMQLFLKWIQSNRGSIKRQIKPTDDKVEVMTIHGSKGLQAPIVILANANSVPRKKIDNPIRVIDDHFVWLGSRYKNDYSDLVLEECYERIYAEYIRLFYVALTRAESMIFVTAIGEIKENSWYKIMQDTLENIGERIGDNLFFTSGSNFQGEVTVNSEKINIDMPEKLMPNYEKNSYQQESCNIIIQENDNNHDVSIQKSPPYIKSYMTYQQEKGVILHKLLEFLPKFDQDKYVKTMLSNIKASQEMSLDIERICSDLLKAKSLFPNENIMNEVKIGGLLKLEGSEIMLIGQVDKIIFQKDAMHIIDFKTSSIIPNNIDEVREEYILQLSIYNYMLKDIFNKKSISSLIWLEGPVIMKINNSLLSIYLNKRGINVD